MRGRAKRTTRAFLATLALLCLAAPGASAAFDDPLFVFTPVYTPPPPPQLPVKIPPPTGSFYGPCGLTVDSSARFYISDYHHNTVDVFSGTANYKPTEKEGTVGYQGQLSGVDPPGGPCGLALDATNRLFVESWHRNVSRYGAFGSFGTGTVFPLPAEDTAHHLPTGIAIDKTNARLYVDHRTFIGVYDLNGVPIEESGEELRIGEGTLIDGYGVAVSEQSETKGRIYVPDAGNDKVKVYDPAVSKTNPIAEIEAPGGGPFTSLRDSAIAIDNKTGTFYFADDKQPELTERPQANIYAFTKGHTYAGRLKHNVITARPPGIAVDNSPLFTQGRVYVTSGNSTPASVYAYSPGATVFSTPLPPIGSGLQPPGSTSGSGSNEAFQESAGASMAPGKAVPSAAASVITQEDNLRVAVEGSLSPKKLPRKGKAPIAVSVGWDIATTDGSSPPSLKKLRIEINRNGRFETEGLPTCPYAKIQPATTKRALSNCKSALVGKGDFQADISLKGQEGESYVAKGRLLVFNGEEKGKPVLFGQIYSASPFATSFVIVFKVAKIKKGDYGTALTAVLPASLRSWGDLTGIRMSLQRRYSFKGEKRSYVSAGCPAPKGFGAASFKLAETTFSFGGGREISSTVTGDCRARG